MQPDVESIELGDTYNFRVSVESGASEFHGELHLSPEGITLKVSGENTDERRYELSLVKIEELICKSTNTTFVLTHVIGKHANARVLGRDRQRNYFEAHYEVGYVIAIPDVISKPSFYGFSIDSMTIAEWVGYTETQSKILSSFGQKTLNTNDLNCLTEFITSIDSIGDVGVGYHVNIFQSATEFSAGIKFPPYFYFRSQRKLSANELIKYCNEWIALLSFITGGELTIKKITVQYKGPSTRTGTVYLPHSIKRDESNPILFPLGHHLKQNRLGLPELPLETFSNYLSLEKKYKQYFAQYVRYRRLENVEERFLGYFRLLEALITTRKNYLDEERLYQLGKRVKPFLQRYFGDTKNVNAFIDNLKRFNAQKYNTQKCITDFLNKLPKGSSIIWRFGKSDIQDICKVRNDLTHANEQEKSLAEISDYSLYIEALLIIALFSKLGVDAAKTISIMPRMKHHYFIKNMIERKLIN